MPLTLDRRVFFSLCSQCGFYHESHFHPYHDKRLRYTRYTLAELRDLSPDFAITETKLAACPSKFGPAQSKPKPRKRAA